MEKKRFASATQQLYQANNKKNTKLRSEKKFRKKGKLNCEQLGCVICRYKQKKTFFAIHFIFKTLNKYINSTRKRHDSIIIK
jgi:hypothetical protein